MDAKREGMVETPKPAFSSFTCKENRTSKLPAVMKNKNRCRKLTKEKGTRLSKNFNLLAMCTPVNLDSRHDLEPSLLRSFPCLQHAMVWPPGGTATAANSLIQLWTKVSQWPFAFGFFLFSQRILKWNFKCSFCLPFQTPILISYGASGQKLVAERERERKETEILLVSNHNGLTTVILKQWVHIRIQKGKKWLYKKSSLCTPIYSLLYRFSIYIMYKKKRNALKCKRAKLLCEANHLTTLHPLESRPFSFEIAAAASLKRIKPASFNWRKKSTCNLWNLVLWPASKWH